MGEQRRKRLAKLLNTIRAGKPSTIEELSRVFGVSTATIRRDVKELEKREAVVQTVGGGVMYQSESTGAVDPNRAGSHIAEKIRIAEYCIDLVRNHDDILIAPGTTTFLVGRILSGITDRSFRIITPSLELALETSGVANIRTVVLGGEVRGTYVTGFEAGHEYFNDCHHEHTLLMSVDGLSASGSLTVFESNMVPVLREMMAVANRTILVLDSSKLGRSMFAPVAGVGDVSLVVTDSEASERMRRVIRNSGAQLVCV